MSNSIRINKCGVLACAAVSSMLMGSLLYATTRGVVQRDSRTSAHFQKLDVATPKPMKQILMWNQFFEHNHFEYFDVGHEQFEKAGCDVTNCNITDNVDGNVTMPVEDFDAIWIHALDSEAGSLLASKPAARKPHQRYIFYLLESPSTNKFNFTAYSDFFNWTATYRRDSDIYVPYGWFTEKSTSLGTIPRKTPKWPEPNFEILFIPTTMKTKNKSVAWLVSNCNVITSKRDIYAEQLSQFIDVDIYGKCGSLNCGDDCLTTIDEDYRFYFASENSLCVDYVTEKFFRSFLMNVVPIVYGGADYKHFAPPRSYIDAADYASPRELAEYLRFLEENPLEYEKYFWWKNYYKVYNRNYAHVLCQMCAMLNDESVSSSTLDVEAWWNSPEMCHEPTDSDMWRWAHGRS